MLRSLVDASTQWPVLWGSTSHNSQLPALSASLSLPIKVYIIDSHRPLLAILVTIKSKQKHRSRRLLMRELTVNVRAHRAYVDEVHTHDISRWSATTLGDA